MPNSDDWQSAGVHWHAFAESGEAPDNRIARRERAPDATLRTPWEVACWIDRQTREHVHHRKVWASREGTWAAIGDEDDLEHLRQENFTIAARGDSIHTDIFSESARHNVYVEAVTDAQCTHGCTAVR